MNTLITIYLVLCVFGALVTHIGIICTLGLTNWFKGIFGKPLEVFYWFFTDPFYFMYDAYVVLKGKK